MPCCFKLTLNKDTNKKEPTKEHRDRIDECTSDDSTVSHDKDKNKSTKKTRKDIDEYIIAVQKYLNEYLMEDGVIYPFNINIFLISIVINVLVLKI